MLYNVPSTKETAFVFLQLLLQQKTSVQLQNFVTLRQELVPRLPLVVQINREIAFVVQQLKSLALLHSFVSPMLLLLAAVYRLALQKDLYVSVVQIK